MTNKFVAKSLPSTLVGVLGTTSSGTEIVGVEKLKINEPSSGTSISEIMLYETL